MASSSVCILFKRNPRRPLKVLTFSTATPFSSRSSSLRRTSSRQRDASTELCFLTARSWSCNIFLSSSAFTLPRPSLVASFSSLAFFFDSATASASRLLSSSMARVLLSSASLSRSSSWKTFSAISRNWSPLSLASASMRSLSLSARFDRFLTSLTSSIRLLRSAVRLRLLSSFMRRFRVSTCRCVSNSTLLACNWRSFSSMLLT